MIKQFGIDLPKEQLRDCFHDVDRDRSGFVSREELIYALRVNVDQLDYITVILIDLDINAVVIKVLVI